MSTCRSPSASREVLVSRSPGQLSHCEEGVIALLHITVVSGSQLAESHTEKEQSGEHEASHTGDSEICETTLTRRDRYSGPRPPRPQYTEEQEDAIRFHRDDLCMTWTQVMNAYNDLYDHDTGRQWESRSISGLQSRYYRLLDIPVNHAKKQSKPRPELGILVMKPHKRYWWMGQAAEERAKGKVYDPEAELEEEYTASDYDDEQENETTGTQDEGKFPFPYSSVFPSLIQLDSLPGLGRGSWADSSLDASGVQLELPAYHMHATPAICLLARSVAPSSFIAKEP